MEFQRISGFELLISLTLSVAKQPYSVCEAGLKQGHLGSNTGCACGCGRDCREEGFPL